MKWLGVVLDGKLSPLAQASSRASATASMVGLIKKLSITKVKGLPPKSGPTIFNMAVAITNVWLSSTRHRPFPGRG